MSTAAMPPATVPRLTAWSLLEDGRPFLVLELLEGESLYERMTRVRQIDMTTTFDRHQIDISST